jgi:hypothetical protein
LKGPGHKTVARPIASEFLHPELAVVGWHVGVLRATVPETAIHEHRDALLAKSEVWSTDQRGVTAPASDAFGTEQPGKSDFSLLVPASPDAGHYFRPLCLRENVRHGIQTAK